MGVSWNVIVRVFHLESVGSQLDRVFHLGINWVSVESQVDDNFLCISFENQLRIS